MAARRYEFYPRVLIVSLARSLRIRIPKRPCNVLKILVFHQYLYNNRFSYLGIQQGVKREPKSDNKQ